MFMKRKININANRNYRRIKNEIQELADILEESKLKDKLFRYEIVRIDGKYNMLSQEARQLVGLDIEDYTYIIQNYSELMKKYPEIKEQAFKRLEDIKSINIATAPAAPVSVAPATAPAPAIASIIATKGCKNCIQIVSNKIDVKVEDLCDNCQKIFMQDTT